MIPEYVTDRKLEKIISDAIAEDIGDGDHSTLAVIPPDQKGIASLIAKEDGVIAGLELASRIFQHFDPGITIIFHFKDGDRIEKNDLIFDVEGPVRHILSAERLVLNFIQRMSGIATFTRKLVDKLNAESVRLLDTRKTTPNLRIIEKWAVTIGGGENHRMGLYDMIMLKDNHIDFAGGIKNAIHKARTYLKSTAKELPIEVETRTLEEVREVLDAGGCDYIMLDNMSTEEMKKAVSLINGKYKTEASGNINEKNILDVASCGVDYISIGALTHSVKSLDVSLKTKF